MARKPVQSEIKVTEYKDQNKNNEKIFKRTEEYSTKLEELSDAINTNAALFAKLAKNNIYENKEVLDKRNTSSNPFFKEDTTEFQAMKSSFSSSKLGEISVKCATWGANYIRHLSLSLKDIVNEAAFNQLKRVHAVCSVELQAIEYAPLRYAGQWLLNIDKKYEELLALDKREGGEDSKGSEQKLPKVSSRFDKFLNVMGRAFGLNQYESAKKTKEGEKGTAEASKSNFLSSFWSSFSSSADVDTHKPQASSINSDHAQTAQSTSTAVAVVNINAKIFEDSIDEGFQKGIDDYYAQAKASCYSEAVIAVKTYSSCLIRGKETGGTSGCLKHQYHSEDLLDYCAQSFQYQTNTKIEELIQSKLAEAQKIEYDGTNLKTHTDSTLFQIAASDVLQLSSGEANFDSHVSCVGGKCGDQSATGLISEHGNDL